MSTSSLAITNAAIADLIRRVEVLEARLMDASDPLWGPCKRCGYEKFRSARRPVCCPRCHSAYWDREPRNSTARKPTDPPSKSWGGRGKRQRRRIEMEHFVSAAAASEAIPPPPRIDVEAARTVDNPMDIRIVVPPVVIPEPPAPKPSLAETLRTLIEMPAPPVEPVEHLAPMPDAVVESILATGEVPTYEEIKAAKEAGDGPAADDQTQTRNPDEPVEVRAVHEGKAVVRSTDHALQAKKDAFFADAISAGLVSPVAEGAEIKDEAPFVAPSLAANVEAEKKDDPFWK